jgi:hypothetical protein
MRTAIYTLTYRDSESREQPKVYIQRKPAIQAFNREAKRLRNHDVSWDSVQLVKWEVVGTPRSVASAMIEIGGDVSDGAPIRQMNDEILIKRATVESELIAIQEFTGVNIDV